MASRRGPQAILLLLRLPTCFFPAIPTLPSALPFRRLENGTPQHIINMANNSRYYYSLPTQAPQSRSGSRRPPLTPSTVSSPCLSTAPIATRRDSGAGSPTKASALLAKVVSHPSTPRGETPTSSPMCTPDARTDGMQSSPVYSSQRPAVWRSESARYVHQQRQQGTNTFIARRGR